MDAVLARLLPAPANPSLAPYLALLIGPYAASHAMLTLSAHLACRGPLYVLDCGNRYNAYIVARLLRGLSETSPACILARIQVARGFNCYQVAALIERAQPLAGPSSKARPLLIIDLLDTFYDESASLAERRRLVQRCIARLQHLAQQAIVVASLRPPPPHRADPTGFLDLVREAADLVLYPSPAGGPAIQLELF